MKILEIASRKAKKRYDLIIFDPTTLFGKTFMADRKHPLAETLRDELILRFLGRNLNATAEELLSVCNSFLYEFRKYPNEVLEHAIKSMRAVPPDEIAFTHLYYFIKNKISEFFGTTDIDELVFQAALSRELKDGEKYHPFIEQIVDKLPADQLELVREQASRTRAKRLG